MKIRRTVWKYEQNQVHQEYDDVAEEYPLTIFLNGEEFATLVCTPSGLKEMTVGFLASEGVILRYDQDVKSIDIDAERGIAYVELHRMPQVSRDFYSKRYIGSCCGKSRQSFYFHNDVRTAKTSRSKATLSPAECIRKMSELQNSSDVFQSTGGVHNAGIYLANNDRLIFTDIGRHNALDKIYGACLMQNQRLKDSVIVFSGRVSSEVLLKVAKMGVGILLSKSAPTELALEMADELNITVVGFLRGDRFNVYTHPERIEGLQHR